MLKKILVCLEGSASADATTRTAIELALAHKARLMGLAMVDEPESRDRLALFERRCRDAGVSGRALAAVERPADSILMEMEQHDLTVFGKDANFRFETDPDALQTREVILHRATGPLLVVPDTAEPKLGPVVLIAYDGSHAAKRALNSFAANKLAKSREIHVATVDDNSVRARELTTRAVEMLAALRIEAHPHNVVSALSNVDALFVLGNKLGAGLMVMGAFAHARLKKLFSGSVTRELLEKATMPLYLQH